MLSRGRRLTANVPAQSAKAKEREDAQRAEALKMDEMLIQIKRATDQVNADREKAQIEANAETLAVLSRVYECCIGRLGPKLILSRLRLIPSCVVSL